MVRVYVIILMLVMQAALFAQEADVLTSYNGKHTVLYLTQAPELGESIHISRRKIGVGEFVKLTADKPLEQMRSDFELREKLEYSLDALMRYLDAEDFAAVQRQIMGSSVRASLSTLLFPAAAEAAGRLFVDTTVTANTEYEYKVEYFGRKNKPISQFTKRVKTVATVPVAPEKLQGVVASGLVRLEWSYPKWSADKNNLAVKFFVYRRTGKGNFENVTSKIIIRDDNTPAVFTEAVPAAAEAEYYVTAVDLAGSESKPSSSVKLTLVSNLQPEPPLGIKSAVQGNAILLSWEVSASPDVRGYYVFRQDSVGADTIKITGKEIPVETPFFTDSLVKPSVNYYYYAASVSYASKVSRMSSLATGIIRDLYGPQAPTSLKTSYLGTFIKLDWKSSKSDDIASYKIFRGESKDIMGFIGQTKANSFIDSGYAGKPLSPGGYYYYYVVPIDKHDLVGTASDTLLLRYVDKVPPRAPSPVMATMLTNGKVHVRVGMTGVADLARVSIYRKSVSGDKEQQVSYSAKLPYQFTDSTVILGQKYFYTAEAIDSAGNKSPKVQSDTLVVENLVVAVAVQSFGAYALATGGVELSWVKPDDTNITGYNIYRSGVSNGIYEKINKAPISGDVYLDKEGTKGQFYKIRAVNNSGKEGAWSDYTVVNGGGESK